MSTFITDLSKLGFAVSLCLLTVLATITATVILASLAVVSLPILIVIAPTLITCLCLYATYQTMYPTLAPIPMDDSAQWERYTAYDASQEENDDYPLYVTYDADGLATIEECATWEEYHAQFTYLEESTPVCSMTYALLATTGTMDDTYLAPAYVTTLSPVTYDDDSVDLFEGMAMADLIDLARRNGIKGINTRWKRETIISKILSIESPIAA